MPFGLVQDETLKQALNEIVVECNTKADAHLTTAIPKRIEELSTIVDSTKDKPFIYIEDDEVVLSTPNAQCKETRIMISVLCDLKLWVSLLVPEMSDGHNSGVEFQNEIAGMLSTGRATGSAVMQVVARYFAARAKLIRQARRFGGTRDWAKAVRELDERHYICMTQNFNDLRNCYAMLLDRIMKNRDRIERPRGEADTGFMSMMMY